MAACLLASCHCADSGFTRVSRTALADPTVDLGRPFVGDVATATLAINSTGRGSVNVTRISSNNDALTLDWPGAPTGQVPPSGTLAITVAWRPTAVEMLTGTIEIDLETDDPTQRHQIAQVSGESRLLPDCDDNNACTDDSFNRQTEQCRHTNTNNTCDDGNACTQEDRCHEGSCRGVARSCDDQNVCTLNLCDPAAGCVFPPDGRICADEDPCTKDVCDPSGGCQHPNADDGTACGAFSCSIAHVCVFGGCHELDVRSSSEGFPCSDGDVCTDGDACHGGACAPGPRRESGPEIVATLDTFGGEQAWVATDGYRYIFVDNEAVGDDPNGLRVALDNGSTLGAYGALPLRATAPPISVGSGYFLVAHGDHLAMVSAEAAARPFIAWDIPIHPQRALNTVAHITHLHPVPGGAVLLARVTSTMQYSEDIVLFVPLSFPFPEPTQFVRVASSRFISDLDAINDVVGLGLSDAVVRLRIDAAGRIRDSFTIPFPQTDKVSVLGSDMAVLRSDTLEVFGPVDGTSRGPVACTSGDTCTDLEPGCDGSFPYEAGKYFLCNTNSFLCPGGSHCESVRVGFGNIDVDCGLSCCDFETQVCLRPGVVNPRVRGQFPASDVQDIALGDGVLFQATERGTIMDVLGLTDEAVERTVFDPMPSTSLERVPGHLLVTGPIALALQPTGGMSAVRRSGEGLGEIRALTDRADGQILLGGPRALGALNLETKSFSGWMTPDQAVATDRVRMLKGEHRSVLVTPSRGETVDGTGMCSGVTVESVQSVDEMSATRICGVYSARMTAVGDRLWGIENFTLTPNPPAADSVCSWEMTPDAQPRVRWEVPPTRLNTGLRASEAGLTVGSLQFDYTRGTARLYQLSSDDADPIPFREFELESDATTHPAQSKNFAVDGSAALTVAGGVVRLHLAFPPSADPPRPAASLPAVVLNAAAPATEGTIVGFRNGRGWIAWRKSENGVLTPQLTEVQLGAGAMSLSSRGTLAMPGMVSDTFEAGPYTVAATNTAVVVLAPGCAP